MCWTQHGNIWDGLQVFGGYVLHIGTVSTGTFKLGDSVTSTINEVIE